MLSINLIKVYFVLITCDAAEVARSLRTYRIYRDDPVLLNPPNAAIGITTGIWLGLFDKLIKVSFRGLQLFEVARGNPGAHDRSFFVQDTRVDHEHKRLDVVDDNSG